MSEKIKNINHTRHGARWFGKGGRGRGVDTYVLYTCVHEQNKNINFIKFFLVFAGLFNCLLVFWGWGWV